MPEWESDSTPPRGGFLDRASHAAAFFGGSLMLAAGMLIVASIATRWFLAASIPGDVELIQAATAVAAFAFLPFGQLNRSNIVVDTFTQRLPERVCTAIDAFWDIVYAAAAVILSWRLSVAAVDAIRSHTVTTVIGLPIGWFMLAGVAMLFLLALVSVLTARPPAAGLKLTPFAVGVGGFVAMFLLIMARMPVALSMLVVGSAGYVYFVGLSSFLNFLNATPYYLFANYTLSVIPLFVLMGAFAERSGLARDLFALCSILVGRMRGGLGISVIGACSIFGAICGSSLATTATFSRAALPEMKRLRYEPAFGSAIIAVGGVVDLLIPPSIILVIYAIIAEQNIAKLFQAALVPGIFAVVLYCLVIRIVASRNPGLAPIHEKADGETRLSGSLLSVWPALLVILVVLGGIYSGIFTATEAAGVGAVLMLLAGLMQRRLRWSDFAYSLVQTATTSAMIFAVLLGAEVFNAFLALTQMPEDAAELIGGLSISPYAVMAALMVFYILLGGVMDELAMMLLTIPVVFPIINTLDFGIPKDEVGIWFGILVLTVVGIGLIAPPIGLGVLIVTSISRDVSIVQVYRRILPFVAADFIRLAVLTAFPSVTLFLVRAFS